MTHGIALQPLIPCRKEPSDKAEMVTQLIFGECYSVLEARAKWVFIKNETDGYECWIDFKQHHPLSENEKNEIQSLAQKRCGDAVGFLTDGGGRRFAVPCSAVFPGYSEGFVNLCGHRYEFEGRIARNDSDSVMRHALRLLHAPYLWGGKSVFGIDCSGLVQVVFACAGINLPRDAWQQAERGETIDFISLAEKGDLVFFDNEEGRINHVGIATGDGNIIHASGSVRIDKIDHEGIYNESLKKYTHKMRIIKRVGKN
ncbi:MAG: NlpC/P60 family protein [Cryomorphaceae bacterium]|nr:C40 family peptidase [Flavobacteriales bacterium]